MLTYPQIGMVYSGQLLNNMIDELARQWIMLYYWPYFVIGNQDAWKDILTWNFPSTLCKP